MTWQRSGRVYMHYFVADRAICGADVRPARSSGHHGSEVECPACADLQWDIRDRYDNQIPVCYECGTQMEPAFNHFQCPMCGRKDQQ